MLEHRDDLNVMFGPGRTAIGEEIWVSECGPLTSESAAAAQQAAGLAWLITARGYRARIGEQTAREGRATQEGRSLSVASLTTVVFDGNQLRARVLARAIDPKVSHLETAISQSEEEMAADSQETHRVRGLQEGSLAKGLGVSDRHISAEQVLLQLAGEYGAGIPLGSDRLESLRRLQAIAEHVLHVREPATRARAAKLVRHLLGPAEKALAELDLPTAATALRAAVAEKERISAELLEAPDILHRALQDERAAFVSRERAAQRTAQPGSTGPGWMTRTWRGLVQLIRDTDDDEATAPAEFPIPIADPVRPMLARQVALLLGPELARLVDEEFVRFRQLETSLRLILSAARTLATDLRMWTAALDETTARRRAVHGVVLDAEDSVTEVLSAQVDMARLEGTVSDYLSKAAHPGGSHRSAETLRRSLLSIVPDYSALDLETLWALLRPAHDQLWDRVLAHDQLPIRLIGKASPPTRREFLPPGGPEGEMARSFRLMPACAQYRVAGSSGMATAAYLISYMPFLRPNELVAWGEGKQALQSLGSSQLTVWPFAALAEEHDGDLTEEALRVLVIKGLAVGLIQPSRTPAVPPFYFISGARPGFLVCELSPVEKGRFPHAGDSDDDMMRNLGRQSDRQDEITQRWQAVLAEGGEVEAARLVDVLRETGALPNRDYMATSARLLRSLRGSARGVTTPSFDQVIRQSVYLSHAGGNGDANER